MAKKILFIDRDGTLIKEAPPEYRIDTIEDLTFYPDMFYYMRQIAEMDFELVMVTNQDGLGEADFPWGPFNVVQDFIMKSLENERIHFSEVHIDVTYPHDNAATRKPGIGMLAKYMDNDAYDLTNSFVIGDRITDMMLAKNLGCKGIWIVEDEALGAEELSEEDKMALEAAIALKTENWEDIYTFLKSAQ